MLELLHSISGTRSWVTIERKLMGISGDEIERGSKSLQMYIYTLATLNPIDGPKAKDKFYFRTASGEELDNLHTKGGGEYRRL